MLLFFVFKLLCFPPSHALIARGRCRCVVNQYFPKITWNSAWRGWAGTQKGGFSSISSWQVKICLLLLLRLPKKRKRTNMWNICFWFFASKKSFHFCQGLWEMMNFCNAVSPQSCCCLVKLCYLYHILFSLYIPFLHTLLTHILIHLWFILVVILPCVLLLVTTDCDN